MDGTTQRLHRFKVQKNVSTKRCPLARGCFQVRVRTVVVLQTGSPEIMQLPAGPSPGLAYAAPRPGRRCPFRPPVKSFFEAKVGIRERRDKGDIDLSRVITCSKQSSKP